MNKTIGLLWVLTLTLCRLHAADPAEFKVSDLTFKRPDAFKWVETQSMMRKAQLKVGDANTKAPGEIVFFYFGEGQGGDVKANVDRWYGQFKEGKDKIGASSETKKVGHHNVTYVRAQGTYMSGMPGGPKTEMTDHALLGAIVEGHAGNVFIKFTGPIALVKANEAAFKEMVESPVNH